MKSKRISSYDVGQLHYLAGNHDFFGFFRGRFLPKAFTCRKRFAQPSLIVCLARAIASAPAGTSLVTTVPVPTYAPSPILTGATKAEFDPIKAPLPMSVRCFATPSELPVM